MRNKISSKSYSFIGEAGQKRKGAGEEDTGGHGAVGGQRTDIGEETLLSNGEAPSPGEDRVAHGVGERARGHRGGFVGRGGRI